MRGCVLGLGVLLFALAACGAENRTPTHFTPSNDKAGTSKNDVPAVPAPAVPGVQRPPVPAAAASGTAALFLTPLDTTSVRGGVELTAFGRLTSVSVSLSGGKPGVSYEGAIRQGGCGRVGATVASLHPVSADSLGRGAASTDVPVPLDSLRAGRHVVVYGKGGRPAACGEIGAAPAAPSPAPPNTAGRDTSAAPRG